MSDSLMPPNAGVESRSPIERRFNAATGIRFRNDYLRLSKSLTYSYLFVLPLLAFYELGTLAVGGTTRIGADVMIRNLFGMLGLEGTLPLSAIVVLVGVGIVFYERKHKIELRGRYFFWMFGESVLYAVVIGSLVGMLVGQLFNGMLPPLQVTGTGFRPSLAEGLVLSIGAGIYEELFFRLILVSLLYWLLRLLPIKDSVRYGIAMVAGALIFSWAHYIGDHAYAFTMSSFVFRALMGLALNGLYLVRGFGIAAMTHSMYDVILTLMGV